MGERAGGPHDKQEQIYPHPKFPSLGSQAEELSLAFLVEQICWQQILLAFFPSSENIFISISFPNDIFTGH